MPCINHNRRSKLNLASDVQASQFQESQFNALEDDSVLTFQNHNAKQLCEQCCIAKQRRKSFKHNFPMKLQQKLKIIHLDVCGPFEVKSLGGNCYFLIFVDEFTRYIWIYLLENKSEVFTKLQRFKLLVEKQVECVIKRLITNGGGEYNSPVFPYFCEEEGIKN